MTNLFITMFPHEPTEKKELQIDIGDLIDVIQTSETGWWKGVCLRTQEGGWFPSSYVKVRKCNGSSFSITKSSILEFIYRNFIVICGKVAEAFVRMNAF